MRYNCEMQLLKQSYGKYFVLSVFVLLISAGKGFSDNSVPKAPCIGTRHSQNPRLPCFAAGSAQTAANGNSLPGRIRTREAVSSTRRWDIWTTFRMSRSADCCLMACCGQWSAKCRRRRKTPITSDPGHSGWRISLIDSGSSRPR